MILTVLLGLIGVNVMTVGLFWLDKQAAIKRQYRIPEKTLLTFALIGGTPGAFYAQQRFRHKTQKEPFRSLLKLIVVMQLAALVAALIYPQAIMTFISNLSF